MEVACGSNPNPATELRSSSRPDSEPASQQAREPILLVEDNKLDVLLVKEAFGHHRITAALQVVEDGEAAIRFIEDIDTGATPCPRLILLDLNLPRRSGTEVLRRIRQSDRCKATKVLVVTSSSSPADRKATEQMGANGYFVKPTSYEEFMKIGEVVLQTLDER